MKQSIHFMYDGIASKDMGVHIAWNSTGLFEENFLPEREIIEKQIANREEPYFQGVRHKPLSFPLSFYVGESEDEMHLRKIARWIFQPYYKPLVFESSPDRYYYAMFEGDSSWIHNGMDGYVELNVRCNSPYGHTPELSAENIRFKSGSDSKLITLDQKNFWQGQFNGTAVEQQGLTVENAISNWGDLYKIYQTWGQVI